MSVTLDTGCLEQIPVRRTAVRVYYRHVWIPGDGRSPDPFYVKAVEGRWPTSWTLYTGTTPAVAWAEYCRNHPTDVGLADITGGVGLDTAGLRSLGHMPLAVVARALFELEFSFDRLADLTSPWAHECLAKAGFDLKSFYADGPGYGDCPRLAQLVDQLDWHGMVVPSAAWRWEDGLCVPIFERGRASLTDVRNALPAAQPSVAIAAATSYSTGRRPRWLAHV